MAKLKYDRPINISARSSSRVQIPNDEVWKVTTSPHNSNVDAFVKLYGGGYSIEIKDSAGVVSGIAFKHVEE